VKKSYRKLVALALFVLALTGASLAQDFSRKVRANIPFSFYAGGKMLPAGNYTLAIHRGSNNVAIFQKDTSVGTFLLGSPHDGSRNGRSLLTFHANSEGTYVLQKIEGPDLGVSFVSDKALSHVALSSSTNSTDVVIAAIGN
jgi:hypothetical protein